MEVPVPFWVALAIGALCGVIGACWGIDFERSRR
jgi:hypothetical protein